MVHNRMYASAQVNKDSIGISLAYANQAKFLHVLPTIVTVLWVREVATDLALE